MFIRVPVVIYPAGALRFLENMGRAVDDLLLHTIFYPFIMYVNRRDGTALRPVVDGPAYDIPSYGRVQSIDTSAILCEDVLHVFLTNRSTSEPAQVQIEFPGVQIKFVQSAEIVTGPNTSSTSTVVGLKEAVQ
jgi:alpha-L-arabinofuranosidase